MMEHKGTNSNVITLRRLLASSQCLNIENESSNILTMYIEGLL